MEATTEQQPEAKASARKKGKGTGEKAKKPKRVKKFSEAVMEIGLADGEKPPYWPEDQNAPGKLDPAKMTKEALQIWDKIQEAKTYLDEQRKVTAEKVAAAASKLRESVEEGRDGKIPHQAIVKLERIETAWADHEDVKAERKETMGAARDTVKRYEQSFATLMENTKQLSIYDQIEKSDAADNTLPALAEAAPAIQEAAE